MLGSTIPDLMKWDAEADEPYLELPSFPYLRLTPWHPGDGDQAMKLFNDPIVGGHSFRRPYPYLREHLDFYPKVVNPAAQLTINTLLRPLLSHETSHAPIDHKDNMVPFFPFFTLRHQPTGTLIGDFRIFQPTGGLPEAEHDEAFGGRRHQLLKPAEQTWEISYNLLPEWRGKGVAGQMMDVVVDGWAKWVGIGLLMATIETADTSSAGLVRSRGFEIKKTFMQPWREDKGGGDREESQWVVKVEEYKSRLD